MLYPTELRARRVNGSLNRWSAAHSRSDLHQGDEIRRRGRAIDEIELASLLHTTGGVDQGGHRHAIERCRQADTPDACGREFADRELLALDTHHEVDRLRQSGTHGAHGRQVG